VDLVQVPAQGVGGVDPVYEALGLVVVDYLGGGVDYRDPVEEIVEQSGQEFFPAQAQRHYVHTLGMHTHVSF
jgi:hypothetical protein